MSLHVAADPFPIQWRPEMVPEDERIWFRFPTLDGARKFDELIQNTGRRLAPYMGPQRSHWNYFCSIKGANPDETCGAIMSIAVGYYLANKTLLQQSTCK